MSHAVSLRSVARLRATIARRCRSFAEDQNGVSAVEFALLLPVMLTLYLGSVEVTSAVSIDRKVTLVSRTVADLVARTKTVTNADLTDVLNASKAVAAPYPSAPLKVRVSSVTIDTAKKAKVTWSSHLNWEARAPGEDVTSQIPQALRDPCATAASPCTVVWGEATYTYTPMVGHVITGELTLSDRIFMKPRLGNEVTKS
ncbi:TadE/TadG family type IV pilus assembly protein [Rhodoplanes sp. SY1]|uniref:TadE/TadG family type IV pilus assembly protein n=1 Tax=Rhodoplanes sp. SY1 TaxID=3166646 RepID=UPI0038B6819F